MAKADPVLAATLHPMLPQMAMLAGRYTQPSNAYDGRDLSRQAQVWALGHHPPANQALLQSFCGLLRWHGPPKPAPRPSITDRFDRDSTWMENRTRLARCGLLGVQVHWRADPVLARETLKPVQVNRALQPLAGDLLRLLDYSASQP